MMSLYIYIGIAFVVGFLPAFIIQSLALMKMKKEYKSMQGLLESERLIKETTQKENAFLLRAADASLLKTNEKLKATEKLVKIMDSDIILLQKSNEETESLLQTTEPALHDMKVKLIEANNTIARLKAQFGVK